MPSWFEETIREHRERQQEARQAEEAAAQKASRERDEFRAGFEFAVEDIVAPAFEAFVEKAREHGFTASWRRENDAEGRLRACMLGIYAGASQPASGGGFDHCSYKITLQMNTRRIAHMMSFDNVPGASRESRNDFSGLESLEESELEQRLREFLALSLDYCRHEN